MPFLDVGTDSIWGGGLEKLKPALDSEACGSRREGSERPMCKEFRIKK